jgi:hypothetical protein
MRMRRFSIAAAALVALTYCCRPRISCGSISERNVMFARPLRFTFLTAAFALVCARALAVPVFPDSTVIDSDLTIPANAEIVTTQDHVVNLDYTEGLPEGATVVDDNTLQTTLHTQVLRDPDSQRLTFVYQIAPAPVGELSGFIMGKFGTVSDGASSVSTGLTGKGHWTAYLSLDGEIVTETTGGEPHFAAATDATEFDSNGAVTGLFNGVFQITFDDPDDPEAEFNTQLLTARWTINGTFQPLADGGGGVTPIPLPAGVWTGFLALSGAGAVVRARRSPH